MSNTQVINGLEVTPPYYIIFVLSFLVTYSAASDSVPENWALLVVMKFYHTTV
jgi:hypothetical protein